MTDTVPRPTTQHTTHEYGERIGATAVLDGERLLLTRRSDNGGCC